MDSLYLLPLAIVLHNSTNTIRSASDSTDFTTNCRSNLREGFESLAIVYDYHTIVDIDPDEKSKTRGVHNRPRRCLPLHFLALQ